MSVQKLLSAADVAQRLGRKRSNAHAAIAALKRDPSFPAALKPWGATGREAWNVEEIDEWRLKHCQRAADATSPSWRWTETDPRRLRALERARVQAAKVDKVIEAMNAGNKSVSIQ